MQEKRTIVFFVSLSVFGVILTLFYAPVIVNAEPYARYSLAVTILVTVMLGGFFWYLQKQDSDNTKKVLDAQLAIVSKIDERDKARKRFWIEVAASHLFVIKTHLSSLHDLYDQILADHPGEAKLTEISERINAYTFYTLNEAAPKLNMAMSQLAVLLDDQSLFKDVNSTDYTWLLETANVRMPDELMRTAMTAIDIRLRDADLLIERIRKEEMPSGS